MAAVPDVEPDERPQGRADLVADLDHLGVRPGDTLIVHASMRAVGRLLGGPATLLSALEDAVGVAGTIVAPAFTTYLADPSIWRRPPPPDDWGRIRRDTPAFDPQRHPAQRSLGVFPELLRTCGRAVRSAHPLYSFAAAGRLAATLCAPHPPDFALGCHGPLQRLHDAGGRVLLIGVGWDRCTLLHLAEHHVPYRGRRSYRSLAPSAAPQGTTAWNPTRQLVLHEGDFAEIGRRVEAASRPHPVIRWGTVGSAEAVLGEGRDLTLDAARLLMRFRDLSSATRSEPYPQLREEGMGRR
ncbi:AAC(3) family N-acetyltransferase (plasmid) [Mycolicibacterium arabiense]|uniref:Aminoglycoside N(3)-acetyltransferase n=1 Tax=Mycolicibacterium arabiense TaxID=1286181 RepID=A0A7I7RPW9_9MYCO|nr:AAC(3) family N-acetyltransferase [Mycolicibacterium arabiense]MCV7372032.1 AAC(3) family N-acetyltransferase [Mycolicibacterium arabiense]BBY46638.1 AAC(3) family N-acetyltransferase [Mycolicibacterium arabiense]